MMTNNLPPDGAFIIYDTEFTSWPGTQERAWSAPGEYREIVQIAAIRVDRTTLTETAKCDAMVRPVINPLLSDYLIGLTGISQNQLEDEGLSFANALDQFLAFCGTDAALSFGPDHDVINENIALNDISAQYGHFQGHDIRPVFENALPHIFEGQGVTSGTLARAVGAEFDAPAHNALNDVRSILAAIRHCTGEGIFPAAADLSELS